MDVGKQKAGGVRTYTKPIIRRFGSGTTAAALVDRYRKYESSDTAEQSGSLPRGKVSTVNKSSALPSFCR